MDTARMKCSYSESESESKSNDHAKENIMEQKSNIVSCKVISMLLLPEDLMIDIISRVSLKCLLYSARYVCKPWATIIGTSHFAEAHCTHSKPGLYIEDLNSKTSSYFLDIKDDLNGHFERIDLGMPPEMGCLMSTCDGLLLCWCYHERVFVVNPILKCCLKVPSPPTLTRPTTDNFIIARVPRSAIFKLFFVNILVVSGANWYVFYVLKIGIDNSWKEIARKKVTDGHQSVYSGLSGLQLVYSGGNDLYWITMKAVMVMDVDKEIIVGEYPLPIPPLPIPPLVDLCLYRNFLWMENHLSCIVHKGPTKTFQIYLLDIDSRKWTLYHEMGPFDYVLNILCRRFRFWMNGQLIFQLFCYQSGKTIRIHFVYNVETRKLTKIEGIAEGDFEEQSTIQPYSTLVEINKKINKNREQENKMKDAAECPICVRTRESSMHIFFQCVLAKEVWTKIETGLVCSFLAIIVLWTISVCSAWRFQGRR